jgi:hypothetical protein
MDIQDHSRPIHERDVERDARAPHPEPVVRRPRAVKLEDHAGLRGQGHTSSQPDLVLIIRSGDLHEESGGVGALMDPDGGGIE